MSEALLFAHASGGTNSLQWAVIGAALGLGVALMINANRRLDAEAAADQGDEPTAPVAGVGVASRRTGASSRVVALALVVVGSVLGYGAGLLIERTLETPSVAEVTQQLCAAAASDAPNEAIVELSDDLQHSLEDLDDGRGDRARRAAQIVTSAASQPDPVDPELVRRLAAELAHAAGLGGGDPCS